LSELLSIVNLPATKEALKAISEKCKSKLEVAESMACTEETKQAVKKLRADLNKEFASYEAERKERTAEYEKPLKEFKKLYDEYISVPFKSADSALKTKIDEVETEQKNRKTAEIEEYAQELIEVYALNWLDLSRIMPSVTLSASVTSLKKAVKITVEKIKSDIDCIGVIDDSGEMFAEYMKCLDLATAKINVEKRKKAVEEAEKAKAVYSQNEEINEQAEEKIDMLIPPTVEEDEQETEKYTMTFTVTATIEQLKALKTYMIENNIEFKNGGKDNE
jgi:hypothetical protein